MRKRFGLRLGAAGLTVVAAMAALFIFGVSAASADGSFAWNGINGAGACAAGTTGTILWIFNPHSAAVPTSLTVKWSDGTTDTYPGGDWTNPGNSQNWH